TATLLQTYTLSLHDALPILKPRTKQYRAETIKQILKLWPDAESLDVRKITERDCKDFALRLGNGYSATRCNGTLWVLRGIFRVAVEKGALYRSPAAGLKTARVRAKTITLPNPDQFEMFVREIASAGARQSRDCA